MLMELLRLLPPEAAHAVTIQALKLDLAPELQNTSDLHLSLFGKTIRNPIGLSAGADKEAAALAGWSKMGFGIVEAGTVTLHPRSGNPQPRLWRIKTAQAVASPASAADAERMADNALINWLGLPGKGLVPFVENLRAFQHHPSRKHLCVGASIASPDNILDEFKQLAEAVAPYVDYITLNASCPNVAGHSNDQRDDHCIEDNAAAQIKKTKQGAGRIPVLLKLGPTREQASVERMVKAALAAGIDGFIATNTVPFGISNLLNEKPQWPTHDGKEVGGYSGKQLLEISCWMVAQIRNLVPASMPVIGVGGVQSGEDARRLMHSGANAIQLYTGLVYKGPALLNDIAQALSR
ncbi:MAG: dihydroorotate dehydrogenase 2 [Alphaproteobacteria bacterium]|nr:dihydroorotate dehydrogenase 2 [Alphaproteobacteria bacterium]